MKRNSFLYMFIVAVILVVSLAACTEESTDDQSDEAKAKEEQTNSSQDTDVKQISSYDESRIDNQAEIEKDLLEEYQEGSYSFEDPFITKDPYGVAPLTALVMFETDEPTQITLTVQGKDSNSDVKKSFDAYETEHQIPVLGLYPNYENTVTIEATNKDGETITTELSIKTDSLPDDFLTTDLVEADTEKMENGLTFIIPSSRYAYAVDDNAEVRWYSTLWNSHVFNRLENGNLLYITKEEGQDKYNDLLEMDMLGKVSNSYIIQLGDYEKTNLLHHDAIELPNGNLLTTTHDVDSDYIEDEMVEIDRKTGETVSDFSFRDILPETFYQDYEGPAADEGDWLHQNAVWYDETDNTILMSSRSQDLVMKLSYPEGEIKWILAAPEFWPDDYEQYLLDPKSDEMKFPGGQHAVMTLPDQDDNDDTTDILLFDNNIVITRGNDDLSEDYSRAVQYRINEKDKTVEEVWSYGEDRGKELFSSIVGDADYLPETGNRLITSGYIEVEDGMNSRVVEVSDQDPAEVIYEIVISGFESGSHRQAYRAERMPLYPKQEWNLQLGEED
ncbi:aryl-sulfate sulfotransferase [Lentibacillus sp. Marseille-P4043]|uniref:aryl-sulfate sulfotransferase n=1 Tax=Lentibacillus sp. Marseille-P4043 TaxID=2040293 RepID=UPI000D0BC54A|nr:aryl-sulfate sulfotransferase [Lentibacillus sp. Marseille-P4043]